MKRALLIAAMLLVWATTGALACGVQRWPIKVGTDDDADRVSVRTRTTTIADLIEIDAPKKVLSRPNSRFDEELRTVRVSGTLTLIKLSRDDDDYHLVIEDGDGNTMIVESPDPECAPHPQQERTQCSGDGHRRSVL